MREGKDRTQSRLSGEALPQLIPCTVILIILVILGILVQHLNIIIRQMALRLSLLIPVSILQKHRTAKIKARPGITGP